jgi:energy-coupling factor transporter transmembrane protein EcfT
LSAWGHLAFTVWAVPAAVLAGGGGLVGLALVELAFGLTCSRRGLRLLGRPRFWALVLAAVALGPFLLGEADVAWGPLRLSREGFATGVEMAGRAFTLTLAFGLGVASLSLSDVVALFGRLGLRGLGFAVAVAANALGTLGEMASVTLGTIRLRGGMRRPWVALKLFLVTTVANALRYGEDVVCAAVVRGFDPGSGGVAPLPLRPGDVLLLVVLAGCSVVLFG